MKTKNYVLTALLLAMGMILHAVIPGFFGMKFDLLLAFMILSIALFPENKNALLAGVAGGILTSLTTTFPSGQLPNVIDKVVTAMVVLLLLRSLSFVRQEKLKIAIVGFLGTLVSGSVFLTSALFIVGLPAPFSVLFVGVVLPTCVGNTIVMVLVYKACVMALRRSVTPS